MSKGFGRATNVSRQLKQRAVYINVRPRPQSLRESRSVLNMLEEFGEVEMFKNLQYEHNNPAPNMCLAIYRRPESVVRLLENSPLEFTIDLPTLGNQAQSQNIMTTSTDHHEPPVSVSREQKTFNLRVGVSEMEHKNYVERQPYYWGYRLFYKDLKASHLAQTVPLKGLSQVDVGRREKEVSWVLWQKKKVRERMTLRRMWEEGREMRSEERE